MSIRFDLLPCCWVEGRPALHVYSDDVDRDASTFEYLYSVEEIIKEKHSFFVLLDELE